MQLRPYQQECLNATLRDMEYCPNVCIQAATGAGKTIFFSALIKYCMERYKMRIGVVAHREQLIRQARDKLLRVWPEGVFSIGLACSSVSKTLNLDAPVVIGSPQTLANRLGDMPPLHMLIVDECHRLPPRTVESQYGKLIDMLREQYAAMRLIGVTATPYRLDFGYIYGKDCKDPEANWFERLTYSVSIKTLQEQGFLVPYMALEADAPDLSDVKTAAGEYNLSSLGNVMSKAIHIGSAVTAVREYAANRQHIVVFATTIEHAEALREAFMSAGMDAATVHSKQPQEERQATLAAFDRGDLRIVCNVGVLTEGWDCPSVDCMLMCRPTLSPALYVQMVGRGLRLAPGKTDCLLLDLSGNWRLHGDPNDPLVNWGSASGKKKNDEEETEQSESEGIACQKCKHLTTARAIVCSFCGEMLKEVVNERLELRNVAKSPPKRMDTVRARVLSCTSGVYTSRAGNTMVRLAMQCLPEGGRLPVSVNHFMDIAGYASEWGRHAARRLWMRLSGGKTPPNTIREASLRLEELRLPSMITIKQSGKYWNVNRWQ